MRGLDTNVLLRYLTNDDPLQSPLARRFLDEAEEQGERFFISAIALCELSWTLRGKPYELDRDSIGRVFSGLLATRLFEIQDRDLVSRALTDYQRGKGDFPDYLLGWNNQQAGCKDTVTFDRKLRKAPGFSFLA